MQISLSINHTMNTHRIISAFTSDIASVSDDEFLLPVIKSHLANYGAENFFFGSILFENLMPAPKLHTISDYPDSWQQRYHEKDYFDQDVTVAHCKQSSTPILWPAQCKNESKINNQIFSESAEFGLKSGISMPYHARNGEHGALAVSTSEKYDNSDLSNPRNLFALQVLGAAFFDYCRKNTKKNNTVQLTQREKECLKWVATGKTSWEISTILSISERTVVFHLQNAVSKMNTSSRTSAAVIAILNDEIAI